MDERIGELSGENLAEGRRWRPTQYCKYFSTFSQTQVSESDGNDRQTRQNGSFIVKKVHYVYIHFSGVFFWYIECYSQRKMEGIAGAWIRFALRPAEPSNFSCVSKALTGCVAGPACLVVRLIKYNF